MVPLPIADDLSADFNSISKDLVHRSGVPYHTFRKTLRPRYWRVWTDILLGYAGILAIAVALVKIPFPGWGSALLAAFVASMGFGYLQHFLGLFMHEGAHYNVAGPRKLNDLLTDLLLGTLQGYSIESYRVPHFGHHRKIGTPEDPEHHYFHALDLRLVVLTLSGVRTMKVILERLSGSGKVVQVESTQKTHRGPNWVVVAGGLIHGAIVVGSILSGHWPLALAWVLGFLTWFPFFITLREILEHRDFDTAKDTDFTRTPHGAISRIFGNGPVAATLGGAGFNRHLLHHWEPQISYTRLGELERFLLETEAGPIIRARQVTYFSTLRRLWQ